ncbi:TlpA family protein disulfide reductase [Gordonia zhaorongruii]|uniref:TlpA family protein disulfide reductase n=1 Tax=Gordonia zhaorongruii TaxID=2597659 RepID=UPI001049668D|nr:TlpA disulfide reductase family protein [Gordonia zhaorongruii]
MRRSGRVAAAAVAALTALAVLAGCATGDDAVAQNQSNQFVSPDGRLVLEFAKGDRKATGEVKGSDLLTGDSLGVADFPGKVVVVNVWASWCPPCRKEFSELEKVYQQTQPKGVEFLGIDFRDSKSTAQDFVRDRKVTYPSIFDYGGASLAALGVPVGAVPTTVILDRDHRPAKVYLKPVTEDELSKAVLAVANEPR